MPSPVSALHGDVLDALGQQLVDGALPEGRVLRTEELAREFGVSRTVAREAVRVLESMGMLSSRRRVGLTVEPRARWNVYDPRVIRWRLRGNDRAAQLRSLSELRSGIEPVAAALAAARATPTQCGALTGAVMDMAVHGRSGDLEAYLEADVRFHRALLEASGNEMLAGLAGVLAEVLVGRTHHHLMPANPEPLAIRLHGDVAEAVRAGDAEAARAAMADIISEATTAMLAGAPDPPGR